MQDYYHFADPHSPKERKSFFARLFGLGSQNTAPPHVTPDQTSGHPPLGLEGINQSYSKDAPIMESKSSENKINGSNDEGHARTNPSQRSSHSLNRETLPHQTLNVNRNSNIHVDTNISFEKREEEISAHARSSTQPQPITNSPKPKIPTFLSTKEQGLLDKLRMRRNDKQKSFWMRDESVTSCYNCQAQFSVLLRKHHCRLCGQIFCHRCTENTVPGHILGYSKRARVCNFCYNLLKSPNICQKMEQKSNSQAGTLEDWIAPEDPSEPQEELLSKTFTRIAFTGGLFDELLETPSSSPSENNRFADIVQSPSTKSVSIKSNDDISSPVAMSSTPAKSNFSEDELLNNSSPKERDNEKIQDQLTNERFLFDDETIPSSVSDIIHYRSRMSKAKLDLDDLSVALRALYTPEKSEGLEPSEVESPIDRCAKELANYQQMLKEQYEKHLYALTTQLLIREELDLTWRDVILRLVKTVCGNLICNVRGGDAMDIRKYLKIKMIPGGNMNSCCVVEGIVFSKNRTHKKMKSEFENPKILLLDCSVEFERKAPRLSSFDNLLAQEEEYLHILVLRIASIKPDIVLVTKNVSRLAQDFMLQEGLCLALNIKPHTMQIIARLTNSDILTSTEHIVTANMGTCGKFHIETYKNEYTRKTCMYIEKCPKHLFNTIVIRGADYPILRKVKKILQFVCYAAYNLKLEQNVLVESFLPSSNPHPDLSTIKRQLDFDRSEQPESGNSIFDSSKERLDGRDKKDDVSHVSRPFSSHNEETRPDKPSTTQEDKILTCSPSVDFSVIQRTNKQKEGGSHTVPPIHPILWFHPQEPNLYTCSHCLQINNIINNIMLANNFISSLSSYDTVYTLAPTSATFGPFDELSSNNNSTEPFTTSQADFSTSHYNDYFDGENNNDWLSEREDFKGEDNDLMTLRCGERTNTSHSIRLNVSRQEYRTALRRNPFGIEFNYRSVMAATEQEQQPPTLKDRRIESTQHIVYLHTLFCHATSSQCITHEMHYIDYYSRNDLTLGQFLENYCFDLQLQCKAKDCNRSMLDHERSFFHHKGRLNVSIKEWGKSIQENIDTSAGNSNHSMPESTDTSNKIFDSSTEKIAVNNFATSKNTIPESHSQKQIFEWSQCKICNTTTPRMTPLSEETWKYSFGKYLELVFYSTTPVCPGCNNPIFRNHIRYFYFNNIVVIFEYEPITVMDVCVPSMKLTLDMEPHRQQRLKEIDYTIKLIHQTCEEILQKLSELSELSKILDLGDQEEVLTQIDELKRKFMEEFASFCGLLVTAKEKTDVYDLFDINLLRKRLFTNTIMWNSNLLEIQMKVQKKPFKQSQKLKEPLQTELSDIFVAPEKKTAYKEKEPPKQTADNFTNERKGFENTLRVSANISKSTSKDNLLVSVESTKENKTTSEGSLKEDNLTNSERNSSSIKSQQNEQKALPLIPTPTPTNNSTLENTSQSNSSSVVSTVSNENNMKSSMSPLILISSPESSAVSNYQQNGSSTSTSASVEIRVSEISGPSNSTQTKIQSNENLSMPTATNSSHTNNYESKDNETSEKEKEISKITQSTVQLKTSNENVTEKKENLSVNVGHGKRIFDTLSHIFSSDKKFFSLLEDTSVHFFFPVGVNDRILPIYENELSSIIAYALNSNEYKSQFEAFEMSEAKNTSSSSGQTQPQPETKSREEIQRILTSGKKTTITNLFKQEYQVGQTAAKVKVIVECTTHYALQFDALRRIAGIDELQYIISLARSKPWAAKGGKSRSQFAKTLDDRFVLKGVSPIELESFLQFAPQYFDYLSKVYFHQVPTALTKIFGVYTVHYKRKRGKSVKQDIIVMENLFYKRTISKIIDLKGSLRGRKAAVEPSVNDTPTVLLDENLLELLHSNPMFVSEEAKSILGMAIWNDTLFLSSLNVMDYSMLVGVDEENNELIVGVIDYMRTYTLDKQLETWVKRSGFLPHSNKVPTIISPKQYKKRFRTALWLYFPMVPSKETFILHAVAQSNNNRVSLRLNNSIDVPNSTL